MMIGDITRSHRKIKEWDKWLRERKKGWEIQRKGRK